MYRLMVVDDEPLFTDGLVECLREVRTLDWEIFKAYHAKEALQRLERTPMDIILLDIQMPGMNGLELHREIKRRWPKCKVLFLTGHDEFGYVQDALRQGVVEYILKTEGDEVIIEALTKVVAELESDLQKEQWEAQAKERWNQAKSSLRKSLFMHLLSGEYIHERSRCRSFQEMEIPLDGTRPILIILGKVDHWSSNIQTLDRSLYLFAIQNISYDLFGSEAVVFSVESDSSHITWFIQPGSWKDSLERLARFTEGIMGKVQEKCASLLKLDVSFVMSEELVSWEEAHIQYHRLKNVLFRHFGLQHQLFLIHRHQREPIKDVKAVHVHVKMEQLKLALEGGHRETFKKSLSEWIDTASEDAGLYSSWNQTHLYFTLITLAIDVITQWGVREEVEERFDLSVLMMKGYAEPWDTFLHSYNELMELLFELRSHRWEQQGMDVVQKIRAFIDQELDRDLSLTRIAEYVSYHPAYLSRLYKQLSGKSLSEEITELRMERAEVLLLQNDMKIHEVGKSIGFESPRYFTKFFKSHTGVTPQEFREQSRQ